MIAVFGNKKGGCGKSTTLLNLAGVLTNRGKTVCIVDSDTNETCNNYIRRRERFSENMQKDGMEPLPFIKVEVRRPDDKLVRDLQALANVFDYVLVDTGGYENHAFKSAVTVANVVYMPFQACQADLEQIKPTLKVIGDIEEFIRDNKDGYENYQIDCRLLVALSEARAKDMMIEARNAAKSLTDQVSISSAEIKYCKEVRKIQDKGLTLSDPVFAGGRAHAKRGMYELLADELDGKRQVKFKRIQTSVQNTQAAGLVQGR